MLSMIASHNERVNKIKKLSCLDIDDADETKCSPRLMADLPEATSNGVAGHELEKTNSSETRGYKYQIDTHGSNYVNLTVRHVRQFGVNL
jgi:hypothetical protein